MATYMFNTRQQQKYDDVEAWIKSDPVLLRGEIAVTEVSMTVNGVVTPSLLMKIGNGEKKYSELDFVYGKSADVYEWAKKESLSYEDLPDELLTKIQEIEANEIIAITNEEIEVIINGK